ncbi:TPA: hypothetical protein QDB28_005224 [Burkholderia vietnamiensis]|uniref:hypothetical protein n=1 Tax=Burkholderia vietnamiensis TaxID=60552 RepID=UPI00158C82E4|nr:hypothetical protein [Burkholderia vietnamiensis]HDR9164789.1 hypothetical protein [Burkholderia vietnamiensis]
MARPKSTVLMQCKAKRKHYVRQVLEADAVYAVVYEGQPIGLVETCPYLDAPQRKYQRTVFPNKGFALVLARRLNDQFKTDKFEVYKMTAGEKVLPNAPDGATS